MRDFIYTIGDNVKKFGRPEYEYAIWLGDYRIILHIHDDQRQIIFTNEPKHIYHTFKLYEHEADYLEKVFKKKYESAHDDFLTFIQAGGLVSEFSTHKGIEDSDLDDEAVKD